MKSQRIPALFVFVFLSIPLLVASAQSSPTDSAAAGASASASAAAPPKDPVSAKLFTGTSAAPSEDAWKTAVEVTEIRIGADARRHACKMTHINEWVRIHCSNLMAARVDILAGEKRDFKIIGSSDGYHGEYMQVQFSMHVGDRRIIQWTMDDTWSQVWPGEDGWMSGGSETQGPMFGVAVQVDWASESEPLISIF
jgi:hypothetical protein